METKNQRAERLRQLVIEHDSYAAVARAEGLTRERVRQVAGNGLTSLSRGLQPGKCIDCKRRYKAIARPDHDGRCERCRSFLAKYGQPWSIKAAAQVRRHTHCKHGHELTEENTYISRNCKTGKKTRACRICKRRAVNAWAQTPEGKATIRERNRQQQEKMKADPVLWQRYLATRRRWYQKRRKVNQTLPRKDT